MDEQGQDEEQNAELRRSGRGCLLTTSQLVLRPPCRSDAEPMARIANNRKIAEQTRRIPHPYRVEDAFNWMEAIADSDDCGFLIIRKSDDAVIGAAGFGLADDGDYEFGYWLGEPYWGKGYATEAAHAVIDYAFANRPVEMLYGRCRVVNAPSRRVLVKCGFQLIGCGMSDSRAFGGAVPVEEFVLERSVWESLKQWGAA